MRLLNSILAKWESHKGRTRQMCCALGFTAFVVGSAANAAIAPHFPLDRFAQLRAQDLRVATVAYRLAIANASRCAGVAVPQFGFVLHSVVQYQGSDRAAAARYFGINERASVMAVVAGSPADKAGMLPGDRLIAIDGQTIADTGTAGAASRASVDDAEQKIADAMRHGEVTLTVSSSQGQRDVHFAAELGCPSRVELLTGGSVNAWADGSKVMIGDGLLRRCATDSELALVIGHEVAHNLLHHRDRLAAEGIAVSGLLPLSATASQHVRETEEEADRLAVALAMTAAYDLSGAEAFIGALETQVDTAARTHPDLARRQMLLRAAIAQARPSAAPIPAQRAGIDAAARANTAASGFVSGNM